MKNKLIKLILIFLLCGFIGGNSFAAEGAAVTQPEGETVNSAKATGNETAVSMPLAEGPAINSSAAVLMDSYTGTVLAGKNIDQKMYPASTTKIMTAILTIENCDLDEMATASDNAIRSVPSGYSIGDIKIGETLSVLDLLKVLMVHSANDAANVLGEHVGGSIEAFSVMMNNKAAEIGCQNTHFVNPSGKHEEDHYSTARDMAMIMQYCMKNETFRQLACLQNCSLPANSFSAQRDFKTTVEILVPPSVGGTAPYYYPYAIAGKTGFTTEAQNCLVSVSKKDDLELTCVVLGAMHTADGKSARNIDTISLFDYGFNNYEIKQICKKGDIVQNIEVVHATDETKDLPLCVSEDIKVLINKNIDISAIQPRVDFVDKLKAPIAENEVVGSVSYTVGEITYKTDLLASHKVEKSVLSNMIIKIAIVLAVLVIVGLVVVLIMFF